MTDPYRNRQPEKRISTDADQAELNAIRRGQSLMDAGYYDERVSGAGDDFASDDITITERWHSTDVQLDTAVGKIHEEVFRRANLLGDAYPFEVRDSQLLYRQSTSLFYEFCLSTCMADNITTGENVLLPRTFERVSALLVQLFFGENCGRIHTGTPRDEEVGSTFFEAWQYVHRITSEWEWSPYEEIGSTPSSTGDEGVDFVVWKNTPDDRKGKLYILGQCACGGDWDEKFNDLNLTRLEKWFRTMGYGNRPARAFTTPFLLSDVNLTVAQSEAGLVFDRTRLVKLATSFYQNIEYQTFRPRLIEMIRVAIAVEVQNLAA